MFEHPDEFLNSLILFQALLVCFCSFLIIKLPTKYFVKWLIIPSLFLILFITSINYDNILGRPYHHAPKGEFLLVDFRVAVQPDGKREIEIWIVEQGKSRLLSFNFNPKLLEQLNAAKAGMKKGGKATGKFKGHGDSDVEDPDGVDIQMHEPLQDLPNKVDDSIDKH